MRIIQFACSLSSGGAERFVVDLSNTLARKGHEVLLVIFDDEIKNPSSGFYKDKIDKGVIFHSLKIERKFTLSKMIQVTRYFKSWNPDIIHFHHTGFAYFIPLLFNSKIKIFETIHSVVSEVCGKGIKKIITRTAYRLGLIRPVTISDICHQSYNDCYNLSNDIHIDNGRTPIKPSEHFELITSEINNLKPSPVSKVFINIARCNEVKNHSLLIRAFNNFTKEEPSSLLLIIGSNYDNELGKEYRKIAGPNIRFLGPKSDVEDYLLNADYFCLSSLYEGLSISLLESLSAGLTPICTAVGGCKDVIAEGKTGYLSQDFEVTTYVNALKRAFSAPLDKASQREYFEKNFSMSKCAEQYIELYKKTIR